MEAVQLDLGLEKQNSPSSRSLVNLQEKLSSILVHVETLSSSGWVPSFIRDEIKVLQARLIVLEDELQRARK